AVWQASRETLIPRLLAMLSVIAVFAPSFFMVSVTRALFTPMSLAVGFSMLASYVLSSTLVPVLCSWFLKGTANGSRPTLFTRIERRYDSMIEMVLRARWLVLAVCAGLIVVSSILVYPSLGRELFPTVDTGQFQVRLCAPTGTRVERTEEMTLKALDIIGEE